MDSPARFATRQLPGLLALALLLSSSPALATEGLEPAITPDTPDTPDATDATDRHLAKEQEADVSTAEGDDPDESRRPWHEGRSTEPASEEKRLPFSRFKDNYVIYGWDPGEVKLAFSFKYRLNPRRLPFNADLYFGYSQTSFWDIASESLPFEDHNFNPELFYSSVPQRGGISRHIEHWRIGLEHQSNGEDEDRSRSWDRLYLRPQFHFGRVPGGPAGFRIAPKLWAILNKGTENADIADYMGYFEVEAGYTTPSRESIRVTGRRGSEKGAVQIDLTVPFGCIAARAVQIVKLGDPKAADCSGPGSTWFNPDVLIQTFQGYGENLLHYNRNVRDNSVRIGLVFRN